MADHFQGEPQVAAVMAKFATFAPGFAGAVLSLAFVDRLSARGRFLTVVVGLACAAFVAPALADVAGLFWPGEMPRSVKGAIEFLTALCAMGCIPPLLDWLRRVAGDPLSLLKVRIGPTGDAQ